MPSIYYPSCVVALGIRFDSTFSIVPDAPVAGPSRGGELVGLTPLVIGPPTNSLSWVLNLVPRNASVTRPSFKKAGTATITLSYQSLPIDPELLEAAQIRVHLGTVNPDDYATGTTQIRNVAGKNRRVSVIPSVTAAGTPDLNTLAFWGIADTYKVHHKKADSEIIITARDLRGIFLESPLEKRTLAKLKLDQPIDQVVRDLLSSHPLGKQMQIAVQPVDWTPPGFIGPASLPSPYGKGNVTRVNLGAAGTGTGGALHPAEQNSKLKYWDAICQYCYLVGAIPFFRGNVLCIRPVSKVYDGTDRSSFDPSIRTPFADGAVRKLADGRPFGVRKLVLGRNIEDLQVERKFVGGQRPRVIEVVSLDTGSKERGEKKLQRVLYPPDVAKKLQKAHATKQSPSGQLTENEVFRISVPGIKDKAQLLKVAEAIFHSIARGEISMRVETRDLASLAGPADLDGNDDPDLLRIEPGDPVEISKDVRLMSSRSATTMGVPNEAVDHRSRSFGEEVEYMLDKLAGKDPQQRSAIMTLVRAVVASSRNQILETQQVYRCCEASFRWDIKSGVSLSLEFQNFIEARWSDTLGEPQNTKKPLQRKVAGGAGGK